MSNAVKTIVQFYQKQISPLLPATCRYEPTCSNYMLEALDKHGSVKGTIMGIARICRCHPFVKGGVDPVPHYFTLTRNRFDKEKAECDEIL